MPTPGVPTDELAGIGLGVRDQLLDVVHRKRRIREQQQRRGRHLRDRREIGGHVERHALVQPLVQHGGNIHQQQGAAVGRRLGDGVDAHHAAGADAVLDHHRLLEPLLQPLGDARGRAYPCRRRPRSAPPA